MRIKNFTRKKKQNVTYFTADFIFEPRSKIQLPFFSKLFAPQKKTQQIWFSVPTQYVLTETTGENAFFTIGLALAIFLNEDLSFEGVVSSELISKTAQLKEYFDYGTSQGKTTISSQIGKHQPGTRKGVSQFFTLGVDSFFTLATHRTESSQRNLIYIDGFDVPLINTHLLQIIHQRILTVCQSTHDRPVFIRSNLREISDPIIGWGQFHVAALAAAATLTATKKVYLPGESFDWPDWGLRAGVDKLFSFDGQQLELVGHNVPRDITIKKIKRSPFSKLFQKLVRVCWINVEQKNSPYNCSMCQKCLRTQLTMLACGYKNTPTFSNLDSRAINNLSLNAHVYQEWCRLYKIMSRKKVNLELTTAIKNLIDKPLYAVPRAYKTFQV